MICANPDSQVSAAMQTIMELPILMAFARFSVFAKERNQKYKICSL
nr:MAG TPA: hypothetical protein [Caudoviricetes sp.]